jgi:hypothetical protein
MYQTIVRVEFAGPPKVVTAIESKTWNEPMMLVTKTKTMVGLSKGRVILQKLFQGPAPSIRAAS